MERQVRSTKRRGNGEGSIFQRADGRWVARLTIGYDGNGKRRRRDVYGATKREVQDKLTRLHHSKSTGSLAQTSKITVAHFVDRWLQDDVRLTTRDTTHRRYAEILKVHVKPRIGGVRLQRLIASDVQGIFSAMERDGLSARTRQFVFDVINMALKCAVRQNVLTVNVCNQLTRPRVCKSEMKFLTQEQAACFLKAAETDRLFPMYVLALTTGMRQGELFALKWPDVDLNSRRLSVRFTLSGRGELHQPKSAKSRRQIELPAVAVSALLDHRKRMLAEVGAGCPFVFCDSRGGYLRHQNVIRRSFRPILVSAGLSIRFHDLRHTYASLALAAGTNVKVVSETLGHASVGFTMDVYAHTLPTMQRTSADAMDRMFKLGG